jgi:hypothetical protein
LYEANRSDIGEANDWFNKRAQLESGLPNRPPKLIRNSFGGTIGGPIVKDRFFFFFNYEGQRTAESLQVTRVVPSAALRQGIIQYQCLDDPTCPASGVQTLSPAQIAAIDNCSTTCPWGPGVNPNTLPILQSYPLPNTDSVGDTLNFRGFTFSAPAPSRLNTFIGKLDLNITQNGNHKLFVRGNLQDDHFVQASAGTSPGTDSATNGDAVQMFPGQPANATNFDNSKGIAIGYTAVLTPNVINNIRYGYVRQGLGTAGIGDQPHIFLRGLDDPVGFGRSQFVKVPINTLTDDLTWTKGKHTIQFGGSWRLILDNRNGNQSNFFSASTNPAWLPFTGIADTGQALDPGAFGFPQVDSSFANSYDQPIAALTGVVPEIDSLFNQNKTGAVIPQGDLILRNYKANEGEIYVQDSWKIKPNLTITAGVRYTLLQPPYETNGEQAAPTLSMSDFFNNRAAAMFAGNTFRPVVSFDLAGQANGKSPAWDWDYGNVAPRFAIAYSPRATSGFWGKLFGGEGKSSFRAGYGIYYDHFGEGVVNTFDRNGSFGLTTAITNAAGVQLTSCAPRITSITDIGGSTAGQGCGGQSLIAPQPGPFPVTPPTGTTNGSFAIYWGIDDKLKTPYSHAFDASFERELPGGFIMDLAYVGRLGRHLLQQEDLAMPLNIVDPSSKIDYFTAMTILDQAFDAGVPENQLPTLPYFENLFPGGKGPAGISGCDATAASIPNPTATQNIYDVLSCGLRGNETTVLQILDFPGIGGSFGLPVGPGGCTPACAFIDGTQTNGFDFFHDQWSSLYSWRSIGNSTYHAGQFMLRHRMTHGVQFDFNYTYSRSIDLGSDTERIDFVGGPGDQIINSWNPKLNRAVSTFDTTHQINSNWIFELPFGRDRAIGHGMGRIADAFVGGWNLSGLARWTSGFPYTVGNGFNFATNWELSGYAVELRKPKTGAFLSGPGSFPNLFSDGIDAVNDFRLAFAGEAGQRNNLRGDGYFGIDMGLGKRIRTSETTAVTFSWQVFNVFNSVRYNALNAFPALDTVQTFGNVNQTLSRPRIMQFGLRFDF